MNILSSQLYSQIKDHFLISIRPNITLALNPYNEH